MAKRNKINKIYRCWNVGFDIDQMEVCAFRLKEAREIYAEHANCHFSEVGAMFLRNAPKSES
jgi:nucleoside diphosphate kinase